MKARFHIKDALPGIVFALLNAAFFALFYLHYYQIMFPMPYGLMDTYLQNIYHGRYREAADLLYFDYNAETMHRVMQTAYKEDPLIEYKINRIQPLSRELYEMHMHLNTGYFGEQDTVNYIGFVNEEWKLITGQMYFPEKFSSFVTEPVEEIYIIG